MTDVFIKLLDMSLVACWLIAAVLILRPLLRRYSAMLCMAAWALVAIRLLCPFSIESMLSLVPNAEPASEVLSPSSVYHPPYDLGDDPTGDYFITSTTPDSLQPNVGDSVDPAQIVAAAATAVWIVGVTAMLIYGVVGMLRLRRRTRTAVPIGDGVYEGDDIGTPFVVGVFRPRIYIPSALSEEERTWVIAHERSHIRWGDAVFKPLGFLVLTLHWFNPLVWVCYVLFCRDMESACDERVISGLDVDGRKAYSHALVSCSRHHRMMLAPLAFGEVNVKQRIKDVLDFKRPTLWIAIAACVLLAAAIPLWFCDPPTTPWKELDPALDEQIGEWVYDHHEGAYLEGDVNAEHHYILDATEKDSYVTVYMWVLYQEYDEQNGEIVEVSGAHIPTVIVAHKTGVVYQLEEYWEAEDGDRHVPSIRARFPMRLWNKATDSERYIEMQKGVCESEARRKLSAANGGETYSLAATVTAVNGTMMTVKPHQGQAVSGEVWVSTAKLSESAVFAVGDEVVIYYDGTVQETYPLQLTNVYEIEKTVDASAPQTQTTFVRQAQVYAGYPSEITTYYQVAMNSDRTYYYVIWDENGRKLDEVTDLRKEPQVQKVSIDCIKVSYQQGTGLATNETIYYNVRNGLKSDSYIGVVYDDKNTVCYVEYSAADKQHYVVFHGLFDTSSYYESLSLENAAKSEPVTDVVRLPDGQVSVTYRLQNGEEATAVFGKGSEFG